MASAWIDNAIMRGTISWDLNLLKPTGRSPGCFAEDEDPQTGANTIRTRTILGSLEDPATGSVASGLAAYLSLMEGKPGQYKYNIVSGVEMGRRSEIREF